MFVCVCVCAWVGVCVGGRERERERERQREREREREQMIECLGPTHSDMSALLLLLLGLLSLVICVLRARKR